MGIGVAGRSVDAVTPLAAEAADRARGQTVQASGTATRPEDSPEYCGGSGGIGGGGEPLLAMKSRGTSPKMRPALLSRISGGVSFSCLPSQGGNAVVSCHGLGVSWGNGWRKGG